ncbi:MAG: hypothetical protein PSV24_14495, partial [Rhodoferax sp.]|nr:hypothetical protein [Rhodoferax sp.]
LIARRKWETKTRARMEIFTRIETWYNPHRRHSGLAQMSPINFEKRQQEKQQTEKVTHSEKPKSAPPEGGLPTVCFAPVDKTPRVPVRGTSPCPRASTMDNPAMEIINKEPEKIGS